MPHWFLVLGEQRTLIWVCAAAALIFTYRFARSNDRAARLFQRNPGFANRHNIADQQIQAIKHARFHKRQIMSTAEFYLYARIKKAFEAHPHQKMTVFAQVALGEVLASNSGPAYFAINSKRVDLLIVDRFGSPLAAIEYQGSGHFQNDAAKRDEIKRTALASAGIRYFEVFPVADQAAFVAELVATLTLAHIAGR